MKTLVLLSLLALASAHATEPTPPITPATFPDVVGTDWRLTKMIVGGEAVPLAKDAIVTLSFEKTGGISGNGSVNRYFGSAKIADDGALTWSEIGMTMMAGPEPLMKQESTYTGALRQTTRMLLLDGQLLLQSADGKTQLGFSAPQ